MTLAVGCGAAVLAAAFGLAGLQARAGEDGRIPPASDAHLVSGKASADVHGDVGQGPMFSVRFYTLSGLGLGLFGVGSLLTTFRAAKRGDASDSRDGDASLDSGSRALLEGIPLLGVHLDVEGRLVFANTAFLEWSGRKAADVLGADWVTTFVPPENRESALDHFRAVLAVGVPHQWEGVLISADGTGRRVQWSHSVRRGADGVITGLSSLGMDVTERLVAEAAVSRRCEEWETVFDAAPAPLMLVDAGLVVLRVNRLGSSLWDGVDGGPIGRPLGELLGSNAVPDAGKPAWDERLRVALAGGVGFAPEEVRILSSGHDGSEASDVRAVYRLDALNVRMDGVDRILVGLEDLTASRVAEDRLRDQTALLATSNDSICAMDLEGVIRFWNRGAERLYGWTSEESTGREAADVVFGGSRPMWNNIRSLVLEEGFWDGELLQCHRNGQQLVVEARVSLVKDAEGRPKSVLLVTTDLTERKQLERQLMRAQRLESLGTMACGVAHDLNNVLTPVQMVVDLLRPYVAGSDGERFLDLLNRSARRGADIIRQLLTFGRGGESSRAEMDLRYLIKENVKILRETFPKSIQVSAELPETIWPVVGDITQLHQVLLNLCVNARDAMPKGGTLTLSLENVRFDVRSARLVPEAKPIRYVVMQVADTGTGIPPEVLERIFDPFFTTKPLGQGTGIGLASVRTIAVSHGGFVQVRTQPGAGSQFRIHLPVNADAVAEMAPAPVLAEVGGADRLVLVVDDEDVIRELLKAALERAGYRVITAADGAEAISVFGRRQTEISAVVVDMMMPFIDGAAAIAMFRKTRPSISLVAISGLPTQREEAEKASGGRISFLLKPFVVRDLVGELGRRLQEDGGGALRPEPEADPGQDPGAPAA